MTQEKPTLRSRWKAYKEAHPRFATAYRWTMRTLIGILCAILLLIIIILCGGTHGIVKYIACPIANAFGLPVSVETFSVYPLTGYVHIANLKVENPKLFVEGNPYYTENNLFELGDFTFDFDVGSLFTGKYTVDLLALKGMRFLYAVDYKTSNVDALVAQLVGDKPSDEPVTEAEENRQEVKEEHAEFKEEVKEEKEPLQYLVRSVEIEDNLVRFYNGTLDFSLPIQLPPISMTDVDNETLGEKLLGMTDTVVEGYDKLVGGLGKATDALKDGAAAAETIFKDGAATTETLLTDGFNAAGDVLSNGSGSVEEAADAAVENMKQGFKDLLKRK